MALFWLALYWLALLEAVQDGGPLTVNPLPIAQEPTTGMDPISRRYVWDIIQVGGRVGLLCVVCEGAVHGAWLFCVLCHESSGTRIRPRAVGGG